MEAAMDFDSLDPGTPLPGMTFPALNRVTLARFAGAVDNYNPLHLDDRVAVAVGKPSVFAPGDLVMAYMARVVQARFVDMSIRRFGVRMLRLLWPGDVITVRGSVVDKRFEDDDCVVDADIWADNQRGETVAKGRVLAVIAADRSASAAGLCYPSQPRPAPAARSRKPAKSQKSSRTARSVKPAAPQKPVRATRSAPAASKAKPAAATPRASAARGKASKGGAKSAVPRKPGRTKKAATKTRSSPR